MEQDSNIIGGNGASVEIDETYAPSRKHARKYGHSKKQSIFGAVERDGSVVAKHVRSTGSRVLLPEIEQNIAKGTQIYSDEYGVYRTLKKRGYSHTTVNHSSLEYVRGIAHTNTIEGFWGNLKNSLQGTYHAVSPKYLQQYVNQFVFIYNTRTIAACPVLLERAAKHV